MEGREEREDRGKTGRKEGREEWVRWSMIKKGNSKETTKEGGGTETRREGRGKREGKIGRRSVMQWERGETVETN